MQALIAIVKAQRSGTVMTSDNAEIRPGTDPVRFFLEIPGKIQHNNTG